MPLQMFIKFFDQKQEKSRVIPVDVEANETIGALKIKIAAMEGIPLESIQLLQFARYLEDADNFEKNSELYLFVKRAASLAQTGNQSFSARPAGQGVAGSGNKNSPKYEPMELETDHKKKEGRKCLIQ